MFNLYRHMYVKAIQLVPFVTNAYVCVYRIKTDCVCLSRVCAPTAVAGLFFSCCALSVTVLGTEISRIACPAP